VTGDESPAQRELLIPHTSALIPCGPLGPLAGSCQNRRRLPDSPGRNRDFHFAIVLPWLSTSSGSIGSVTGHSATRPRQAASWSPPSRVL